MKEIFQTKKKVSVGNDLLSIGKQIIKGRPTISKGSIYASLAKSRPFSNRFYALSGS